MADGPLARLRARLQGFNSTGDMASLLGDDLLRDIASLRASVINLDMAAVEVIAWLYWYRSQALPATAAAAERESATGLFELIYVSDPQAVPVALQPLLAERRAAKMRGIFADSPFGQPGFDVSETMRRSAEHYQRYHLTNDPALLDDAIAGFRKVADVLPRGHTIRPLAEVMIGFGLQSQWERSSRPELLDEAETRLRSGLTEMPQTHEQRPMAMAALATMLLAKYVEHEDPALLTEASALMDDALAAAPPGDPLHERIRTTAAMLKAVRPSAGARHADHSPELERARRLLAETPPGHPDRPLRLLALCNMLIADYLSTGTAGDLDQTTALLREAITVADAGSRPSLQGMLGCLLSEACASEGDPALAGEAVGLLRDALAATPAARQAAPVFGGGLAIALWQCYLATGEHAALAEAIAEGRQALDQVAADSPARRALLHNLSIALHDLHRATGDEAALDEAIGLAQRSLRTLPVGTPEHRTALNSLVAMLLSQHERTGDAAMAEAAVSHAKQALAESPLNDPHRFVHEITLAQALARTPQGRAGATDLLRAAAHAAQVNRASARDLQHVANALASALLAAGDRDAHDLQTVEEAIRWLRTAITASGPCPSRDRSLGLLGKALQARFELTKDPGALAAALTAFDESAGADSTPPRLRVLGRVELARTAAALRDWPLALRGYTQALADLPGLVGLHLDRSSQERQLSTLAGVAADAAACALNARQPEQAVEVLERGRGVLLTQALAMRGDVEALATRDPASAGRLTALRDQLDALGRLDHPGGPAEPEPTDAGQAGAGQAELNRRAQLRRGLAAEWDAIVDAVRSSGDEDFLRHDTYERLAELADQGPVVVLNISRYRSDALILSSHGLQVVRLGRDLLAQAQQRARSLAAAVRAIADDSSAPGASAAITDTMGWLWDAVAEKVLGRLGLLAEPAGDRAGLPPRVWWCAGGPLALLPMHAAARDGVAVVDRVVSSYTPTLRALRRARQRVVPLDPASGMLVVAMAETPGLGSLPWARQEADWLAGTLRAETLLNERATVDRVLAALPRYPVVHFACHGLVDLDHPSASRLICYDRQDSALTVAQLSRLDLPRTALAYLSACSTSRTSETLADEAVHLAGAFQLAGYPQVIGTLWEVDDEVSAQVVKDVYTTLSKERGGLATAAFALHEAILAARRAGATEHSWAPYLHVGV